MTSEQWFAILSTIITAIIAWTGKAFIAWVTAKYGAERLTQAIWIADAAAKFTEQTVRALHGEEKLRIALNRAQALAAGVGIKLSDDQWRTLIEQSVRQMKELAAKTAEKAGGAG